MPIANVARWDGASWTALGSGTDHIVLDLSSKGGSLLVGGGFGVAGGKGSAGLALWDEYPTDIHLQDLHASRTDSGVALAWKLSPRGRAEIIGIRVQRSPEQTGPYEDRTETPLDPRETTSFHDRNSDIRASYWYRLVLQLRDGESSIVGPVYIEAMHGGSSTEPILKVTQAHIGVQIHYHLEAGPVPVMLRVFDVRGRYVVQVEQSLQAAGDYVRIWDRRDSNGRNVPNGLYFVQLAAGELRAAAKFGIMN